MLAVVSLLAIITVSLTITRIATVVLVATGLTRDVARFQARSAFSGVGFTTSEAESVVNHPVRRRVIMMLVLLGSAGVVTTVTTLLLSFSGTSGGQTASRILAIVGGLVVLRLLAGSRVVDRGLIRFTEWALRRYTTIDVHDYDRLLHISGDFTVAEIEVDPDHWLAGSTLADLRLREEGVIVLGAYRGGTDYVGVPAGSLRIDVGDVLVVYGEDERILALTERPAGAAGDEAHQAAVRAYAGQRAPAQKPEA